VTRRLSDADRAVLYDAENAWAADDDFFLALASRRPISRVLDLGCGTGRLTVALAAAGHRVTGVDPDEAAIARARSKPGSDEVTWLVGDSQVIPRAGFDLAIMTSHVAQAIWRDDEWARTLRDLAGALASGGRLAFDSRDPAARAWEAWNPVDSRGALTLPDGTGVEGWFEVLEVDEGRVTFVDHTLLPDGTDDAAEGTLAFRTQPELRRDLTAAGFTVDAVYGGWHHEPVGAGAGELVVLAHRAP
jgi:SAM-dependent methyltransferase